MWLYLDGNSYGVNRRETSSSNHISGSNLGLNKLILSQVERSCSECSERNIAISLGNYGRGSTIAIGVNGQESVPRRVSEEDLILRNRIASIVRSLPGHPYICLTDDKEFRSLSRIRYHCCPDRYCV